MTGWNFIVKAIIWWISCFLSFLYLSFQVAQVYRLFNWLQKVGLHLKIRFLAAGMWYGISRQRGVKIHIVFSGKQQQVLYHYKLCEKMRNTHQLLFAHLKIKQCRRPYWNCCKAFICFGGFSTGRTTIWVNWESWEWK